MNCFAYSQEEGVEAGRRNKSPGNRRDGTCCLQKAFNKSLSKHSSDPSHLRASFHRPLNFPIVSRHVLIYTSTVSYLIFDSRFNSYVYTFERQFQESIVACMYFKRVLPVASLSTERTTPLSTIVRLKSVLEISFFPHWKFDSNPRTDLERKSLDGRKAGLQEEGRAGKRWRKKEARLRSR